MPGITGLGSTNYGTSVAAIINEHFRDRLVGQSLLATETLFDMMARIRMMVRMSASYGSSGLTACAISAVDLAVWDAKGKVPGWPASVSVTSPRRQGSLWHRTAA